MVISCRLGEVFAFGGDLPAASVDGHVQVANRLRRPSCRRVVQDEDAGKPTATLNLSDFANVATILPLAAPPVR